MSHIGRAWRGEAELWTVFWLGWLWPVLFIFICMMLASATGLAMRYVPAEYMPTYDHLKTGTFCGMLAILLWYMVWKPVATWRCAWNCDHVAWTYLARIHAGLTSAMGLLTFALLGLVIYQTGFTNIPALLQDTAHYADTIPGER